MAPAPPIACGNSSSSSNAIASTSTSPSTAFAISPSPSRLSPPRMTHTTPTRTALSRSSSARSEMSMPLPGDMRQWTPKRAVAVTSIDGKEGRGKVMGKVESMGDAERGLSSLYVENERHERVVGKVEAPRKKGKKTWGGSLVNGAMNAGVFGAAIGLTAYRIWSGEDSKSPLSPTQLNPETPDPTTSPAGPSSPRSRPTSVEFPPPPAYSESNQHTLVGSIREDEAWVDLDMSMEGSIDEPGHRRTPSRTSPQIRQMAQRQRKRMSRGKIMKIPTRSVASITVEDIGAPLVESPPPLEGDRGLFSPMKVVERGEVDRGQRRRSTDEADEEEQDASDPGEVLRRLDAMGQALQQMIAEAQKALATPSPVVASEGWEDEIPSTTLRKTRRRTIGSNERDERDERNERGERDVERRDDLEGELRLTL